MTDRGDKLAGLNDGAVFDDGQTIAFTIRTATGGELRVHCPLAELGDVFSYLGHLAKAAGEISDMPAPAIPHGQNYLAPVPASGIAFQPGANPEETLIVIRLTGFDLAFAVPSSGLAALADDIRRIALTLSAGRGQPQ